MVLPRLFHSENPQLTNSAHLAEPARFTVENYSGGLRTAFSLAVDVLWYFAGQAIRFETSPKCLSPSVNSRITGTRPLYVPVLEFRYENSKGRGALGPGAPTEQTLELEHTIDRMFAHSTLSYSQDV